MYEKDIKTERKERKNNCYKFINLNSNNVLSLNLLKIHNFSKKLLSANIFRSTYIKVLNPILAVKFIPICIKSSLSYHKYSIYMNIQVT